MGFMNYERAREQEQKIWSTQMSEKIQFFLDRKGKNVSFSIGNQWHHVKVLEVNSHFGTLQYSEKGLPSETWMEIEYIDKYKDREGS